MDRDDALSRLLALQREAFARERYPAPGVRLDRLRRLGALLDSHGERMAQAISADFGNRSLHETAIAETFFVQAALAHTRKGLARWMKPRRVSTSFHSLPGTSRILPQPLGVIGVMSPWNYPLQLALAPVVAALAAGNRALVKPSEVTPGFSALLAEAVAQHFDPSECAVVLGDAEVGKAFARQRFDHLFFTGSTAVGRQVAMAAAPNLTPVTLELGGKSPAIVDSSAPVRDAAVRIAAGKLFNAGQTCIAPDYVLVPRAQVIAFADDYRRAVLRMYPSLHGNPDYTTIVNQRHYERLLALAQDAQQRGARVLRIAPDGEPEQPQLRRLAPMLLLDVTPDMDVMREEIFGPLLPVIPYDSLDEAIAFVNGRPHPLALYWFGRDRDHKEQVLRRTLSGGVTINDVLLHIAQENLPFGGVGESGIGAYHGEYGFRLFSQEKPVFEQSRFGGSALLRPPYGPRTESVLRLLRRLV
ncbi:MAG TPA: coniferyl aldehyde dehydrogenase [Ramlibacter sp.]